MKKRTAMWKMSLLVFTMLIASAAIAVVSLAKANYIWKAYFYPGSISNLRGYPMIDPPNDFTETWVHYSYMGRPLAMHAVVNGREIGKQIYLYDDETPYLVRYLNKDGWERDEISLDPPASTVIPWFLPQRWINPSLDRLALLDELFPPEPVVFITEEIGGTENEPMK